MINTLIECLSAHLGMDIFEANNSTQGAANPYGSYLITGIELDPPHQSVRVQKAVDETMLSENNYYDLEVTRYYGSSIVLQLAFHHLGDTPGLQDILINLALAAWLWMNEEGRNICRDMGCVLQRTKPRITPQVTESDTGSKYRVTLDITLTGTSEYTSLVESITSINLNE